MDSWRDSFVQPGVDPPSGQARLGPSRGLLGPERSGGALSKGLAQVHLPSTHPSPYLAIWSLLEAGNVSAYIYLFIQQLFIRHLLYTRK